MTGVRNGYPVLEDGRVLEVANVIWCTGFTPNHDWIDLSLPSQQRHSHSRSGHRRILSGALLHRASLSLLAELVAGGRRGTRCRAYRSPHRLHAGGRPNEQCPRVCQVRVAEPLREVAVDFRQHAPRLARPSLASPESRKTDGGPQFEHASTLGTPKVDGRPEAPFGLAVVRGRGLEPAVHPGSCATPVPTTARRSCGHRRTPRTRRREPRRCGRDVRRFRPAKPGSRAGADQRSRPACRCRDASRRPPLLARPAPRGSTLAGPRPMRGSTGIHARWPGRPRRRSTDRRRPRHAETGRASPRTRA